MLDISSFHHPGDSYPVCLTSEYPLIIDKAELEYTTPVRLIKPQLYFTTNNKLNFHKTVMTWSYLARGVVGIPVSNLPTASSLVIIISVGG